MPPRLQRLHGRTADVAGVLVLAALVRLVLGPGAIGYDGSYAVLWGRDLGRGELPVYEGPFAPTPHPLLNLVAAPLSWLGDTAHDALVLLVLLSFGALGWFALRLGSRLFTPLVGGVFALLVLTRPTFAGEALQGLVDIPFLALVVAAGVAELRRPRRPLVVLALLAAAGLLRPEGWGLAALYAVVVWRHVPAGRRPAVVAAALAGPVLWTLSDLLVTGDPLHSLQGTRALAEELERPRGVVSALETMPAGLQQLVEPAVAAVGMLGALLGVLLLPGRTARIAAVGGAGLAGYLVLGLAGLPVLTRYLLVPAVVVALLCAVALGGWQLLPEHDRRRRPWQAGAALAGVAVAASLVPAIRDLGDLKAFVGDRRAVQQELRDVVRRGAGGAAVDRCRPLHVPEYQPVPLLAFWLDRPTTDIPVGGEVGDGAAVAYASPAVARVLSILPRDPPPPPTAGPGVEVVERGRSWLVLAGC